MPTIYSIAGKMAILDLNLRYWEWNHIEACHDRLTFAPDGFPVRVWRPSNRFLARLLKSGKYKDVVVKGHLTMAIGPGFPIHYTGPHMHTLARGTTRASSSRMASCSRAQAGREYSLGDKAYVGEPQIITEWKGKHLPRQKQRFNLMVQHYRGRVEHLISEVVDGRKALSTTWRGSFSLLAAVMKISAHMVGLQERMKGPRYDVFGPWPVCPPHIAAQYP